MLYRYKFFLKFYNNNLSSTLKSSRQRKLCQHKCYTQKLISLKTYLGHVHVGSNATTV